MRAKTFTVPFSKIVGDEATELEFGPDDYLVVRPIFSLSAESLRGWVAKLNAVDQTSDAAADQLILDMLDVTCQEWHLTGSDGPIERPRTQAALLALPGAITGSLFGFLSSYRGDGPHPTPLN